MRVLAVDARHRSEEVKKIPRFLHNKRIKRIVDECLSFIEFTHLIDPYWSQTCNINMMMWGCPPQNLGHIHFHGGLLSLNPGWNDFHEVVCSSERTRSLQSLAVHRYPSSWIGPGAKYGGYTAIPTCGSLWSFGVFPLFLDNLHMRNWQFGSSLVWKILEFEALENWWSEFGMGEFLRGRLPSMYHVWYLRIWCGLLFHQSWTGPSKY